MARPTGFAPPAFLRSILAFGPNPIAAFRTSVQDVDYGRRLSGAVGHIPIGDPQTTQRHGWLPAQQAFVGAQQLTNLVNASVGLATAIPATKPNPGIVPLTAMQRQLMAMPGQTR